MLRPYPDVETDKSLWRSFEAKSGRLFGSKSIFYVVQLVLESVCATLQSQTKGGENFANRCRERSEMRHRATMTDRIYGMRKEIKRETTVQQRLWPCGRAQT